MLWLAYNQLEDIAHEPHAYKEERKKREKNVCVYSPTITSRTLHMSHMRMGIKLLCICLKGEMEKKRRKQKNKKKGNKYVRLLTYNQFEHVAHESHAYGNQIALHIFEGGNGKEKKKTKKGGKTRAFTHLQSTRGHCAWATCVWESDRPGKC